MCQICSFDGDPRVVMECTGRYYDPVAHELSNAGLFVSTVNPKIIKEFHSEDITLRKVKFDKADGVKIAHYALDRWLNLKHYGFMDVLHIQLKTMNCQFNFYMKQKVSMKNNLISILDLSYPGAKTHFDSF